MAETNETTTLKNVKNMVDLVRLVEKDVRKDALIIDKKIFKNVNFEYSSVDNSKFSENIVNALAVENKESENGEKVKTISINMNFSKLSKLGKTEAYSILYGFMYDTFLKKKNEEKTEERIGELYREIDEDKIQFKKDTKKDGIIAKFIYAIFDLFSSDIQIPDFSDIAVENIAHNLAEEYGITKEDLFADPESINANTSAKELIAKRYGKLAEKSNKEQSLYLLSQFSENEFQALATGDVGKIEDFCTKFVKSLLINSGLSTREIPITFKPSGPIGSYIDYGGTRQEININIEAIRRMKNPAEVVMTLAHEFKHSIDSTKSKSEQAQNGESIGYGLKDNLVSDPKEGLEVFANESNADVKDFATRLNDICYKINPNERSATSGEMVALDFMQSLNSDSMMQKYIDKSMASYKSYQKSVVVALENCDKIIQEYETKFKILNLSSSERNFIEDRIKYITDLKNRGLLNTTQELEDLKQVDRIQNQTAPAQMGD